MCSYHVDGSTTITAAVVDECAGCTGVADLILTPNAYEALTGDDSGDAVEATWHIGAA